MLVDILPFIRRSGKCGMRCPCLRRGLHSVYQLHYFVLGLALVLTVWSCSRPPTATPSSPANPIASTYSIGGAVTGVSGTLVLQLNGINSTNLTSNGSFSFSTKLQRNALYEIKVLTQPAGQICAITGGTGTVGTADVTSIRVDCTFTVGGTVTGLVGIGLAMVNASNGDTFAITENGNFTFAKGVAGGGSYNISVQTAPTNPAQICAVTNGNGTVSGTVVTNIQVACGFTIGGVVTGLSSSLVLQNGSDNFTVSANGVFAFGKFLVDGAAYNVTVLTQPSTPTQYCTVNNGRGMVVRANITNLAIVCKTPFSISSLSDPMAGQQWHLLNTGQTAYADNHGIPGMDINADPAYRTAVTGLGIIAAVVDTGLEIRHEDLAANVVPDGSWDFNLNTTDPTSASTTGDHGTSVAGLIAAARNSLGGIGVAPDARLKGFNFISSVQTDSDLIASLGGSSANPNSSDVSVFNQSWGYENNYDLPIDPTVEAQYASGVTSLRSGKGAVYVKSAGNGFTSLASVTCPHPLLTCQNASFDPINTIPYQIVVGAVNASGLKSSYSTAGSAIWVSAPGGEFGLNFAIVPGAPSYAYQPAMVTVDQSGCNNGYSQFAARSSRFNQCNAPNNSGNYTNTMNGTSSAAPITSGVIALILEANSELTWRDVKHILAKTARPIDVTRADVSLLLSNVTYVAEPRWMTNAAGYNFHNWFGFGMVDAGAAVNLARTYALGQLGTFKNTGWVESPSLAIPIPDSSVTGASHTLAVPAGTVNVIEAVQIRVSAVHTYTGDLAIEVKSPSGTRSVFKNGRDGFWTDDNLDNMVLLSNAFYGESAVGNWTIKLVDTAIIDVGSFTGWAIRIYGH